jgi:hypothetical protein
MLVHIIITTTLQITQVDPPPTLPLETGRVLAVALIVTHTQLLAILMPVIIITLTIIMAQTQRIPVITLIPTTV